MATHYSNAQDPTTLSSQAECWANHILKDCKTKTTEKQNRYPILVYQGMSGVGTATALALALREADPDFNFGMLYVRKENENSHGERVEYNIDSWDDEMKRRFIFVDDFVSTGASYAHAMYMAYNELDVSFKNFNAAKTSIVQMNHSPFNCETNFNTLNSMVKKLVAKGARK